MRCAPLAALLLVACGAGASIGGSGTPVRPIRPEDRVLLGDFSRVTAIATSSFDRAYVAFPTALAIWRPQSRTWDVPRSPSEPRLLAGVGAMVVDPVDQSAWLALGDGWLHYVPEVDRWDRGTLPGQVQAIATDPMDPSRGIWFRTDAGWFVQPRVAGSARPATPPRTLRYASTVDDAMRDMPQLRALAPTLALGPRMTQGRFTAAAPLPGGTGWLIGTDRRGVFFFDRMGARPEPLPLGIQGDVVGSMVALDDMLWVATDGTIATPALLTQLSADLARSETVAGLATSGLPFEAARRLLVGERALWVASDRGLVRVALPDGAVERFDEGKGIPDQRVLALTQVRGKVLAGTMAGIAGENGDGAFSRRAEKFFSPVYALVGRGDTAWAGTSVGVAAYLPGEPDLRIPDGLRALTGSGVPVYGIGYLADTLVAMTASRVLWRDPVNGAWSWTPDLSATLGQLTAMHVDNDGLWVGGTRGASSVQLRLGLVRPLLVPSDLPDQVTAITRTGRWLWIGTGRGLVRWMLDR